MQQLVQSLKIGNYRGLDGLELPKLRWVNVIGGLNGTGKSTLLESIFTILDANNPTVTFRPIQWRQLAMSMEQQASALFADGNTQDPIALEANTRLGRLAMSITYEQQPLPPTVIATGQAPHSTMSNLGMTVATTLNGAAATKFHVTATPGEGVVQVENANQQINFPPCTLLSRRTMDLPNEIANRYSEAVSKKRKKRVLELARVISDRVDGLQLLKTGNNSTLFAELGTDEYLLPLSLVGDGAIALVNTGLAIMQCESGAVMVDELDAALHFSKLKIIWTELFKLARDMNCQIFAATHSNEAITAMAAALADLGRQQDLLYMRLDRLKEGVRATAYSYDELTQALAADWEVR